MVRDSKNPAGPVLRFGGRAWRTFLAAIKAGEFTVARLAHLHRLALQVARVAVSV